MKKWQIAAVLVLLLALMVGAVSCQRGGEEEEISRELVEVSRGDLTVTINGNGNIEIANEAKLSFGVAGMIDKMYVEEGDEVGKGDKLAIFDTGPLELALTQAEVSEAQAVLNEVKAQVGVTQAELAVTQAETGITQAEIGVTQAEGGVIQAEIGVTQAQVALELAKLDLDRMEDVQEAKDKITDAEYELKIAQESLKEANNSGDDYASRYWRNQELVAQLELAEAQQELADLLADPDYADLVIDNVVIKKLQLDAAEQSLEQAQQSLKLAQQSLKLAQQSQKQAEQSLEQAQQSLEQTLLAQEQAELNVKQARQSLKEALKQVDRAIITAPFSGVVPTVFREEGDTVVAGAIIFHLIDPTAMELRVEVDEIDMPNVELGQSAIINIDALPDLQLMGRVTYISPLSKVESGVVLYDITIGFDVPENSAVRIGMSASADIITEERSNVRLVPSRAVTEDSQGNSVVKVMVGEQIQERPVETGITNLQQTEIVDGLKDGDVVVIETRVKNKPSGGFGLFSD